MSKLRMIHLAAIAGLLLTAGCGDKGKAPEAKLTDTQAAAVEHAPPPGKAMSPGAVNKVLSDRGFKTDAVRRKGSTYVVDATGKTGNKVRMVIDGKAGQIKGLDVIRWAPGAKRIKKGSRGVAFVNDTYEFGYTLPDTYFVDWIIYQPVQWITYVPWIDYGDDYVITDWSEVTYESYVEEVTYEQWVEYYGEIETWSSDSFYDDSDWDTEVESYYAENSEEFEADYGYDYSEDVFDEDYYVDASDDEAAASDEGGAYTEDDQAADDGSYEAQDAATSDDGSYDDSGAEESPQDQGDYDDSGSEESPQDQGDYDDSGSEESSEDDSGY